MNPIESCLYNGHVNCMPNGRKCKKCGWNPEIDKERRKATRKKMGVIEEAEVCK